MLKRGTYKKKRDNHTVGSVYCDRTIKNVHSSTIQLRLSNRYSVVKACCESVEIFLFQ